MSFPISSDQFMTQIFICLKHVSSVLICICGSVHESIGNNEWIIVSDPYSPACIRALRHLNQTIPICPHCAYEVSCSTNACNITYPISQIDGFTGPGIAEGCRRHMQGNTTIL